MTTLHLACLSGSSNAVNSILSFVNGKEYEKEFLSMKSSDGMNAFHYACLNWNSEVLLTLLQSGKYENFNDKDNSENYHHKLYKNDLNEDGIDKIKPLHVAIMTGCLKSVDLILNYRQQALQAEQQHLIQIKQIEQAQKAQKMQQDQTLNQVSKTSQNEQNLQNLALFIQRISPKKSKKLLSNFPQQFQQNQNQQKNQNQNLTQNQPDLTEDPEYLNKQLIFRKRNQELSHYSYIINSTTEKMNKTPLIIAVQYNDIEIVSFLAKQKLINLNLKDKIGRSPLHLASILGYDEIVKILLHKKGIILNEHSSEGMTPLHYACMKDHPEVVSLLLKYQSNDSNDSAEDANDKYVVDVNARTPWTLETPLHFTQSASVLNLLINEGLNLDLNAVNRNGMTALHIACKNINFEVAKILIEIFSTSKIDVNLQDKSGKTPLHYACLNSDFELTKALLQVNGININLTDNDGLTPIMAACKNPNSNLIDLILSRPELTISDQDRDIINRAKEIKV